MKFFLAIFLLSLLVTSVSAQGKKQKIVFDVTSTDPQVHKSTLLMMKVMSNNYPKSTFEVMVYGKALPMLMKGESAVAAEIAAYVENEHVIFTACEVSMELLFHVDKSALLEGVGTVENAVPEIVKKQKKGWGYIKVGK